MKTTNVIIYILSFSIFISSISINVDSTNILNENSPLMNYTHTVFAEVATSQNCIPCDGWNDNIYNAYISGEYDFEYVEMIIFDHNGNTLNNVALNWGNSYNIFAYPTTIFDGDYQRIFGNLPSELPGKLDSSGNRAVANIQASMVVTWLGNAVIQVEIEIKNNGQTQYNGHIRASITEIISRYDTHYGNPYHFGFLDFAFNKDISINPGGTYTDSTLWNGYEHGDNHGDNFGDIVPENIQVTMGIMNNNNGYVDETVAARIAGVNNPPNEPGNPSPPNGGLNINIDEDFSWSCSDPDGDPLKYDVYFGPISPPQKVSSNQSETNFDPGTLNHEIQYYWKIIARDDKGASTEGPIWSFTTKEKTNIAPTIKILKPNKGLYIFNKKILPRCILLTKIIGSITIEVNALDEDSGIEKVEFYINNKIVETDTTYPYSYFWANGFLKIFHIYFIKVIAYDLDGKTSTDRVIVEKYL